MEAYTGEIRMFAGPYTPEGWLACDGSLQQISQYEALYSLIGNTYGGNGTSTFGLPDLRGRLPIGQGQGQNLTNRIIAQSGGSETVQLVDAEMFAHTHPFNASLGKATSGAPALAPNPAAKDALMFAVASAQSVEYLGTTTAAPSPTTTNSNSVSLVGGAQPHANIMPGMAVNFIIWPQPAIYPQRAQ